MRTGESTREKRDWVLMTIKNRNVDILQVYSLEREKELLYIAIPSTWTPHSKGTFFSAHLAVEK